MKFLVFSLTAAVVCLAAPAAKKLAIVRPLLSQMEDGAPVSSGYEFLPGETIHFSCQVEGYQKVEDKSEVEKLLVTYQVEARDPRGVLLQPVQEGKEGGTGSGRGQELDAENPRKHCDPTAGRIW